MNRLLLCFLFCLPLCAQEQKIAPSQQWRVNFVELNPNVKLPAHVIAPQGELTLFADFDHAVDGDEYKGRHVPLYLVNRASRGPAVESERLGSIKLEYQKPDGTWARAEADDLPGCGVRDFVHFLQPGEHFKFNGYRPWKGIKAKVRFASYSPELKLVSNIGDGTYLLADAEASKWDPRTLWQVPATLREKMFGNSSLNETVAAFTLQQEFGPVPAIDDRMNARIEEIQREGPKSQEEKTALSSLLTLRKTPKHAEARGYQALGLRCLNALENGSAGAESFGSPESVPDIIWGVLADLAKMETNSRYDEILPEEKLPFSVWRKVYELAITQILQAPQQQQHKMTELLGLSAYADEFLVNASWEPLLGSETWTVRSVAAATLVRRKERGRLIEVATGLKPEYRSAILGELAKNLPWHGLKDGDEETAFWELCVRQRPLEAVYVLRFNHDFTITGSNPYGEFVRRPLREFWLEEAAKGQNNEEDFELVGDGQNRLKEKQALEFLAAWHDKKDIPVFQALLKHRGYIIHGRSRTSLDGKRLHTRQYPFRVLARNVLMQLEQEVPADLVTELETHENTTKPK
jgi:hypothetical protein